MKNFFKKILSLCCLSALINSGRIDASLAQMISGVLLTIHGGIMTFGCLLSKTVLKIFSDEIPSEHKKSIAEELKPLFIFNLLYGSASLALGIKTLYDTYKQEKAIAEKNKEEDVEKKLIKILKEAAKKK